MLKQGHQATGSKLLTDIVLRRSKQPCKPTQHMVQLLGLLDMCSAWPSAAKADLSQLGRLGGCARVYATFVGHRSRHTISCTPSALHSPSCHGLAVGRWIRQTSKQLTWQTNYLLSASAPHQPRSGQATQPNPCRNAADTTMAGMSYCV
jgi:hypothetical protein